MATYFYPVELRDPNVPRERSFFFIELDAPDAFAASCLGSTEADAMLIAYKPTQICKWAPVRDRCPSVDEMLELRSGLDAARYGLTAQRTAHRTRVRQLEAA